ncbi:recombinase family protein [Flavobacterium chungangensis]|uniref:Recombinase family protein n=1 Tax=Flavobacterium chungangensis TaxID=2708132 RepID=A0ABV8ZCI4_9FLAO
MKNYVAYLRVSTSKQSIGLDAQKKIIDNYINEKDIILETFVEKESGRNNNRVALNKAIDYCKDNNAVLLIAKLDRLSRNVAFISALMESKLDFVACDIPIVDKFTIHLYAAFAELEADKIKNRTKDALNIIKANIERDGFHISKAGNRICKLGNNNITADKRKLAVDAIKTKASANENNIKAKAFANALSKSGHNLTQITAMLNDNGFRAARGGKFHLKTVSRLL